VLLKSPSLSTDEIRADAAELLKCRVYRRRRE
jgi:hypothetical protein